MNRAITLLAMLLGVVLATVSCVADAPLDVAPDVDLNRFQGKWYEIASLPRTTQTNCYGTTAFYSRASDGSLQFVNQCNFESATGSLKTVTMTATVPDPSQPAKLALDVGGFYGAYWIVEVGSSYEYAVVGHPSRSYLWILARTPTLDPAITKGIIDRAQNNHFDTSKLQFTPQPPAGERLSSAAPVGPVPAPTQSGGCSASPIETNGAGAAQCLGLLAAAMGILRSRRPERRRDSLLRRGTPADATRTIRDGRDLA
jgi:apolipoprotein D and lipocalin family protein